MMNNIKSHLVLSFLYIVTTFMTQAATQAQTRAQTQQNDNVNRTSSTAVSERARAHRLWGALGVNPYNYNGVIHANSEEGKQEVMDMWAAVPDRILQTFDEIESIVGEMPQKTTTTLSQRQQSSLRQTISEFLGIEMLPSQQGPDRLIAFHTLRRETPNLANASKTHNMVMGKPVDDPAPANMKDLLMAIWNKLLGGQSAWEAICPEGCMISVRNISSVNDQFAIFPSSYPLGVRTVEAARGGSVYFDVARTLNEALKADGKAMVASVTLLVRHRENPDHPLVRGNTYPTIFSFRWEPSLGNWVYDGYFSPIFPTLPITNNSPAVNKK